MGEVWLAEDLRLHRPVALKTLRRREECPDEDHRRLLREARIASALNHPNIAVVYDIEELEGPDGSLSILAMEYVPGRTLTELAADGALGLDEILEIAGQAADALAEAHRRGVVHRDVKPSNLMVAQGRVKVLDFGLALDAPKTAPDATTRSATWAVSAAAELGGTLHYLSPEQALGRALDARSDLFSLGVVLWELLAGRRPFEGANAAAVVDAILHREPPPLTRRFESPAAAELERLVLRLLAKDPAARPASAGEVRAELTRLRSSAPTAAAGDPPAVAIAPIVNLTGHGEDEWLGTALAETLAAALQEIEGLTILGGDRVLDAWRRLGDAPGEIGAERAARLGRMLGARWMVCGSFQRLGEQVRLTGQVIEVESGRVARAARADGPVGELFAIQDRIVAELVSGLRGTVAAAHEGDETKVVAAFEALSKGLLNVRSDSYESLDRGILFFERALAADPGYARALLELGTAYAQKADHLVSPELNDKAIALLRRALDLRPRHPRSWRELGLALVLAGRVDEGIRHLEHALALAPEDPLMLGGLARGRFLGRGDFAGAAELFERAVLRNPQAGWYWLQLAHCLALLRDFARGEAAARRAIALQEAALSGAQGVRIVGAWMRMGHLAALQGRLAEARDAYLSELAFVERLDHALRGRILIELRTRAGAALQALGERERAQAALAAALEAWGAREALGADDPFTRYYAAAAYALVGEREAALDQLERSAAVRSAFVVARARVEPEWDSLRGDPRFEKLLAGG